MAAPVNAPVRLRAFRPRRGRLTAVVPPEPPPRRTPGDLRLGSLLGIGLILPGLLIVLFGGFLVGASRVEANRSQDVLYGRVATSLGEATMPVAGIVGAGAPLGILQVDALGLDDVFVMGSGSEQTMIGPGLRRDSVLPGQTGVSVLVGRRATYGAPFAHLSHLHVGDPIRVITGQGTFTYRVDVVRRSDAPASTVGQAVSRLTLITSDPPLTPGRQLVVSAALVGRPQAATLVASTLPQDEPGKGSHGRGVALLLWSQALLAVTYVASRAGLRFPRRAVWIGAAPVLLAVLWNVFENLAVLLPNTL